MSMTLSLSFHDASIFFSLYPTFIFQSFSSLSPLVSIVVSVFVSVFDLVLVPVLGSVLVSIFVSILP